MYLYGFYAYVDYVPYRMCGKCKECGKCPMIYAEKLYKMQKCHFPGRMDVKLTFLQGMLLLMVYAPAPCGLGCVVRSHRWCSRQHRVASNVCRNERWPSCAWNTQTSCSDVMTWEGDVRTYRLAWWWVVRTLESLFDIISSRSWSWYQCGLLSKMDRSPRSRKIWPRKSFGLNLVTPKPRN